MNFLFNRKLFVLNYLIILSSIFISCQEGLIPELEDKTVIKTFLSGTINYVGGKEKFPDSTQCFGIYVVAFKKMPKDSSGIFNEFLAGNVYIKFESQPYPVDSSEFELEIIDAPSNIEYIAVSMQTDSLDYQQQKVIGVYTLSGDNTQPSQLYMNKGDKTRINIKVDFDNLPPQPFK